METLHVPAHVGGNNPHFQPKEKHRLNHGIKKYSQHPRVYPSLSQNPQQHISLRLQFPEFPHHHGPFIFQGRQDLAKVL